MTPPLPALDAAPPTSKTAPKYLQRRAHPFFSSAMHEPPFPPQPHPEPEGPPPFERPVYEPFYQQASPFEKPLPEAEGAPSGMATAFEEPITLRSVASDVLQLVQRPRPTLPRSSRPWKMWTRVVGLYLIGMVFAGIVASAGASASGATNLLDEMSKNAHSLEGRLKMLALAGIIAPLWEETAFRLPLAPFHPARLWASLALLGLLFGSNLPFVAHLFKTSPLAAFTVALAPAGLAAIPTLVWPRWRQSVEQWWARHFRWVLALSTLGFGFAHAGNYVFGASSPGSILLIPLLVMPQLVGGLLLAYSRLKLGFWFGVLLHSSVNTAIMLLVLSAPNDHAKPTLKPKPALKSTPHSGPRNAPRSTPGSRRDEGVAARPPASSGARGSAAA